MIIGVSRAMGYKFRDFLGEYIDRISKAGRHFIRRTYLRNNIKQYIKKPYVLTKEQKKEAWTYWSKYTKHFSPLWHEFYLQKTGKFDVRYVPDDVMWTEIEERLNDWDSAHGIDNKCNYSMYFQDDVKMPTTLFRKMRGIWHGEGYEIISKEKAIENCFHAGRCILKFAVESGQGSGVRFWNAEDGKEKLVSLIDEMPEEAVAQTIIEQHPALAAFHKDSINCIRIITLAESTGIRFVSAYFRIGQGGHRVDYHGGVTSSISEDGILYSIGCDNDTCDPVTQHECGIKFENYVIPNFEDIKQTAIKLHQKMGDFRWISWDFSLSPAGEPIFIEMNLKYGGLKYHQLGFGPVFGDDTDRILNEVYAK